MPLIISPDLLSDLATAASGGYYFVEDDSNVAGAFGDALGGIMSVVAQSVTAKIKVPAAAQAMGVEIVKIYHDQTTRREDGTYTVNVGDFYAEETRDVLVQIKLATPPPPPADRRNIKSEQDDEDDLKPIPHVAVSLAYSDTVHKTLVQGEEHVASILRPDGTQVSSEDAYVAAQLLRVSTAEGMGRAQEMADRGDLKRAKKVMDELKKSIRSAPAAVKAFPVVQQLNEDLDLVTEGMASVSIYETHGSKRMKHTAQTHTRQRCSAPTHQSQASSTYKTTSKTAYMAKMTKKKPNA